MKKRKPYWEMTTAELREATREFDQPLIADKGKPLSPAEQDRFRKAREHAVAVKRGRPRIGHGAARITTTIERSLLQRADTFAKSHGLTRAQLIAQGMERILAGAA